MSVRCVYPVPAAVRITVDKRMANPNSPHLQKMVKEACEGKRTSSRIVVDRS